VVDDGVARAEPLQATDGDEPGAARAGADERPTHSSSPLSAQGTNPRPRRPLARGALKRPLRGRYLGGRWSVRLISAPPRPAAGSSRAVPRMSGTPSSPTGAGRPGAARR